MMAPSPYQPYWLLSLKWPFLAPVSHLPLRHYFLSSSYPIYARPFYFLGISPCTLSAPGWRQMHNPTTPHDFQCSPHPQAILTSLLDFCTSLLTDLFARWLPTVYSPCSSKWDPSKAASQIMELLYPKHRLSISLRANSNSYRDLWLPTSSCHSALALLVPLLFLNCQAQSLLRDFAQAVPSAWPPFPVYHLAHTISHTLSPSFGFLTLIIVWHISLFINLFLSLSLLECNLSGSREHIYFICCCIPRA